MTPRHAALVLVLAALSTVSLPATPAAAETTRQRQWHLDAVHAIQAQQLSQGAGVTVAVIDTGVDASHPDLRGAVQAGVSVGGSTSDKGLTDPHGHGTAMAGLIAARGGGPDHFLGVAPQARILSVAKPADNAAGVPAGIRWAVDHGAKVINMSFGGRTSGTPEEVAAISYAQSKDVVLVAGSGNHALDIGWPADLPGVLTVGGTNRDGSLWSGSAKGDQVAISAPASEIVSTEAHNVHPDGLVVSAGTSNSTAIVSGVAALVRSRYPDLDAANVVNRLIRTAVDKGDPGRDKRFGFGIVDAYAALTATVPPVTSNPLGSVPRTDTDAGTDHTAAAPADDGPGTPLTRLLLVGLAFVGGVGLFILLLRLLARRRPHQALPAPLPPGYGYPPGHPVPPGPPVPPGRGSPGHPAPPPRNDLPQPATDPPPPRG